MKIIEAINILNITNYDTTNIYNISLNELKKQYHIQCLIYHPDKNINNNDNNYNILFSNIQEAYNTIKKVILIKNNNLVDEDINENNYNEDYYNEDNTNYNSLILNFINLIIKYYSSSNISDYIKEINDLKQDAKDTMEKLIINLLDNFSVNILEDLYIYLLKYNNKFNYNKENFSDISSNNIINNSITNIIINTIKKILQEKLSDFNIYILTPNINNLLNNDIYKLDISNEIICIPLWHNELNFENNIIKIDPILDDNIKIDENNNIHYKYYNEFTNLIECIKNNLNIVTIKINNFNYELNINKLRFDKYQTYVLKNKGIPKINVNNIMDNTIKSDIIFHIYLS